MTYLFVQIDQPTEQLIIGHVGDFVVVGDFVREKGEEIIERLVHHVHGLVR